MKKWILLLSLSSLSSFLTGCYDELKSSSPVASTSPYISADDFLGVNSAINLTTGIQVSWLAANPAKNILGYRIYRFSGSTPLLIATVGNSVTSYIDGNVISGSKYQYMVRTVDPSNAEDANTARASTLAWAGLTSVFASDLDKITLNFDGTLQGVTFRFYIQRSGMTSRQLVKNLTNQTEIQTGEYVITNEPSGENLRAGAEYTVTAEVYESGSNRPDGNTKAYVVSTKTYGYDGVAGQGPGWKNVASVRAFGRAPDIQQPANTNMIPNRAQVDIGFLPFNLPTTLATSKYRYVIFRFGESEQINTASVTDLCPTTYTAASSSTISSVKPCIIRNDIDPVSGLENGLFRVQDNSVWISTTTTLTTSQAPPRYRYTMAVKHLTTSGATTSSYVEGFPMPDVEKFSVVVPVPPDYMVLVNRESANFEFCYVQRKSAPDPLMKNRCQDSEVGNKPLNSGPGNAGLNLEDGYYDFGYNLFVDRYPLACNADSASDSATFVTTKNSTYGTSLSTTVVGSDVTLSLNGSGATGHSSCNYRDPVAGWLTPSSFQSTLGGLAGAAFARTLTNKPDGITNKFKFSYPAWSSELSQQACENFSETGYGTKRIPRLREHRALMAPPFQQTIVDLNVSDFYFTQITAATASSTTWSQGNCLLGPSGGSPNGMPTGVSVSNLLDTGISGNPNGIAYTNDPSNPGPRGYAIGVSATAYCVSKYGVSDILETPSGNSSYHLNGFNTAWYPVSDYFLRSNKSPTSNNEFKGLLSPIDSGNIDVNTAVDFTQTGYVMVIGTTNTWSISTSALTKFNLALGLPIMSNSSAYAPKISTAQNYGQNNLAIYPSTDNTAYYGRANSRYSISFSDLNSYNSRVRCVLPAD